MQKKLILLYCVLTLLSGGTLPAFAAKDFNIKSTAQSFLFVDGTNGNAGIGTTAPLANLQIGAGTNTVAGAPTLGTNDALITGDLVVDGKIYGDGSLLSNLPGGAEADTLDSVTARGATTVNAVGIGTTTVTGNLTTTGNVGVGSTVPGSLLDVAGTAQLRGAEGGAGLYVSSAGNVGIGVTSPVTKLHIFDTSAAAAAGQEILRLTSNYSNSPVGSGGKILFTEQSTNTQASAIRGYTFGVSLTGLAFDTGWGSLTTKMVIDNAGNVGIGTTRPVAKLDVMGAGSTSATTAFIIRDSAKAAKMTVLDDGNVGFGTTAPLANLQVGAGTNTVAGAPILGANDALITGNLVVDGKIYGDGSLLSNLPSTAEADTLDSVTDRGATTVNAVGIGTTTVTGNLTTTGNVGVGTINSSAKLHVSGGNIRLDLNRSLEAVNSVNNIASLIYLDATNYVKIGEIVNANGFFLGTSGYVQIIGLIDKQLKIKTNDVERFRIDSIGNVGIGTTAPLANLQVGAGTNTVAGAPTLGTNDALITGDLVVDGKIYGDGSLLSNLPGGAEADTLDSVTDRGATTVNAVGIGTTTVTGGLTTTGNVGIGTILPTASLHVVGGSQNIFEYIGNNTTAAGVSYRKARGSVGSRTVVEVGDNIGMVQMYAYDGSSYASVGNIKSKVESVSGGNVGVQLVFLNSDSGGNLNTNMLISSAGNVGIGTTVPAGKLEVSGQYFTRRYSATASINWANGNVQYFQLSSGNNNITFTGAQPGGRYLLELKQPGGGAAGTVTWDANVKWSSATAPDLTDTNSQTDIVTFFFNGTNYAGAASLDYAL